MSSKRDVVRGASEEDVNNRVSGTWLLDRAYARRNQLRNCVAGKYKNQGEKSYRATAEPFHPLRP